MSGKLQDGFHATYDVQIGVRAASNGRIREFDAVAFPRVPNAQPIVFEQKYVTNSKNRQILRTAIAYTADAATLFDQGAVPVVIGIYEHEVLEPARMGQIWSRLGAFLDTLNTPPRVVILHKDEFDATSGAALRRRIGL